MGFGGSGSAGGGSAGSGAVEYPEYMESRHENWLTDVNSYMVLARTAGSPFVGIDPYDPDTDVNEMLAALLGFSAPVAAMDYGTDWRAMVDAAVAKIDASIIDDTTVNADINAFADMLDDNIDAEAIPRFEAGMVDINSVVSSAFVIGRGLIIDGRNKAVAKYGTELRLQNYRQRNDMIMSSVEIMTKTFIQKLEFLRTYCALTIEIRRIAIVSGTEEANQTADFADRDARWDLETFQYGANMMGSIAGAAVSTGKPGPSQTMSALGGALSGAAAGAMVGSTFGQPVGGAVVGGMLGLGASFL